MCGPARATGVSRVRPAMCTGHVPARAWAAAKAGCSVEIWRGRPDRWAMSGPCRQVTCLQGREHRSCASSCVGSRKGWLLGRGLER